MASSKPSLLIVAGEASSALYGERLLEHWQKEEKEIRTFGVGDRAMSELGFEVIGRSEEMGVVGFQEVIANYSMIKGVFNKIIEKCEQERPNAALLMDYPGFNLRLAKRLKKMGIPVVYFISPQVWAWKRSRVKDIRASVEKMLVLFPFEVDFYKEYQVPVEFTGHPLLDELDDKFFTDEYRREHRQKYGITDDDVVLGLMPGSRYSELRNHLQVQLDAAMEVTKHAPEIKVALFVAPTFSKEEVQEMLPTMDLPLIVVKDKPFEMIHLADVVLCASGTATLLVGLMEKALVIMYKMNPVTAWMARRLVTTTKYFGMVNLILDEEVGREFFQADANPGQLSQQLLPLLKSNDARDAISERLKRLKALLGRRGAIGRVAEQLEPYLGIDQ